MAYEILKPEWGAQRPILGVLFDMDGLVLDTEKLFSRFWREACSDFGYTMSYGQSLQMRALSRERGQQTLCRFFGAQADYTAIRSRRIERMEAFIAENGVAVKPGIFELLAFLKERGIPAAITSSSPQSRIRGYLARHGLDTAFDALISGRDVPRGKPEPDIYLRGAEVLGLEPEQCLALEDAPAGILSAYRAGCLPVMIPDLDQPDDTTLPLLYAKADSLHDILQLINAKTGHP